MTRMPTRPSVRGAAAATGASESLSVRLAEQPDDRREIHVEHDRRRRPRAAANGPVDAKCEAEVVEIERKLDLEEHAEREAALDAHLAACSACRIEADSLFGVAAIALVAIGSGWYHHAPSNATLVWDRLPMTVAFMALFAAVLMDRVSTAFGRALIDAYYADVQALGGKRWDTSSLIARLERARS